MLSEKRFEELVAFDLKEDETLLRYQIEEEETGIDWWFHHFKEINDTYLRDCQN